MTKFRISQKAIDDIDNIWVYTVEKWSIDQADRYYKLIFDEIRFVANHPLTGLSIDYVKDGYRMTRVKSHLIFYRIERDEIVDIVRVLHKRMDAETKLRE